MESNTPASVDQHKVSLERAFQLASAHQQQGRLSQAEQLAAEIVKANPRHMRAWQLRAILANQAGNHSAAIEFMTQTIQLAPQVAMLYANRAEMYRQAGKTDNAIADAKQAIQLNPALPQAHSNLGVALYDQGDIPGAETAQREALRLKPDFPQALNNLGSICRSKRDWKQAEDSYRHALAVSPNYLEAANNLGAVLLDQNRPEDSLKVLQELIQKAPDFGDAYSNLGNAQVALKHFGKAEAAYNRALTLRPTHVEALEGLAQCALQARQFDRALQLVEQSMAIRPGRAQSLALRASIRADQGYPYPAMEDYDKALRITAADPKIWIGRGRLLMEMGRMDEAETAFLRAHEIDPDVLAPRLSLAHCRKTREDDENLKALETRAQDMEQMSPMLRTPLHFALGKCYEDLKRYDEAMEHFIKGCQLRRKRIDYNAENQAALADNIRRIFTAERVAGLIGKGASSNVPILVLGMPRSGTTLTETIIASHPLVYGAGELPDLLQIGMSPIGEDNPGYPLNCELLSPDVLVHMGETYVARVRTRSPGARFITDKMPANYQMLGLARLMLPNAKIVHVKRNPVDTCVSNFTKQFRRQSQPHSYDLTELGRYYRNYLDIMAHWRSVLPKDSFYEVQYEQLVANQEEETRKLIAYCGLEWDESCMTPHKTERRVKTASITQVRQPVYTSSVERWRCYEKYLGPLLDALGDAVPS